MPIEKYTLDEYAQMMRENRSYLFAIQELVEETKFGQVELTMEVRDGDVKRMDVIRRKKWLKPEPGHKELNGFAVIQKVEISH